MIVSVSAVFKVRRKRLRNVSAVFKVRRVEVTEIEYVYVYSIKYNAPQTAWYIEFS